MKVDRELIFGTKRKIVNINFTTKSNDLWDRLEKSKENTLNHVNVFFFYAYWHKSAMWSKLEK